MPEKQSLADKFKSLGVKPASSLPSIEKKQIEAKAIQNVVEGSFVQTKRGETFVHEQIYDAGYVHGNTPINVRTPFPVISEWAQEPRYLSLPLESYTFLDTETSGLAGGTGTYAFMIGAARFSENDLLLKQFFMRDPGEEPALLEAFADFIAPCRALVTFNGKAFDAPLLAARYTLHHMQIPFKEYAHLDLLPLARRLWRDRLPSRALKYLEENILLAPRTVDEVPGYEIPYLYFDYLRTGDAEPLKGVFYHNAMDIVAMVALLRHVSAIIEDPFSDLVEHGLDTVALGKLFEDLGHWDIAARLLEHGLEKDMPEVDFWETIKRLSSLQKRRGDLETALCLWKQAAENGHVYAHIELAKYHEHISHDITSAISWTESALQLVEAQDLPLYVYNHWLEAIKYRRARLARKKSISDEI